MRSKPKLEINNEEQCEENRLNEAFDAEDDEDTVSFNFELQDQESVDQTPMNV